MFKAILLMTAIASPLSMAPEVGSESSQEASASTEAEIEQEPISKFEYSVKEAAISYRDSEQSSYSAAKDGEVGSYFLSADGWNDGDEYDILMTIKGNITTKLESKVVYVYEYKPTLVTFNGKELKAGEDRVYTLEKPEAKGEYDLSISFTKTIITNPVDLTHVNWASLLTVQNLMTIGSWAVIVVGIIVLYAINRKYKKRGTTTLQEVQSTIIKEIDEKYGQEYGKAASKLLDTVVAPSFAAIDSKLSKMDSNQSTLIRCLLLMQENTPEARLAITECLSKLDTSADEDAAKVKAIIESQMREYDEKVNKRLETIEAAQKANEKWSEAKSEESAESGKPESSGGYDGTSI